MRHTTLFSVLICLLLSTLVPAQMTRQVWNETTGESLQALIDFHADKLPGMTLNPAPDIEEVLDESFWENSGADNFTSNLWGWVTIPQDGIYTWYLHADDHSILYVSTDSSMDNLQEVASVDGWVNTGDWNGGDANPTEEPFAYTAGQKLAVYAIQRDGVGGDNLGIGWIMPGSSTIDYISDYVTNVPPNPGIAKNPAPGTGSVDVLRDSLLTWAPGEYAGQHNVYFGDSAEDIEAETVPTVAGSDANSFDPGRLEFGKTYYWRVDEINETPDKAVHKGDVWDFTVEPYSIQIPGDAIVATASSFSSVFSAPERTIDGSGLNADGAHSIASDDMWFTTGAELDPWIQYEFTGVQKLDTMKIWNSNGPAEMAIGWGVKDVEIAYSVDGENWDVLADANQFSRAPGLRTYNQPDEIAFGGAAAKFVRFNIATNWGGMLMSYSLSEVQFFVIPAQARQPVPADADTDVLPDSLATWRSGRDAAQHTIYADTDANAVADGLAPSVTSNTNALDLTELDLQLDETYYWRVDEVNEAEATPVWAGPVWSFSTGESIVVDDFEGYNNFSPDRPFQTWLDGFGYSADEFFPVAYGGNGTGSGVGHDIWGIGSPHYEGQLMERNTTIGGSSQSMPFYYTNSGGVASQIDRALSTPQDWTGHGIETLSLAFHGTAGNTGELYIRINDTKVPYDRDPADIGRSAWHTWNIDLGTITGLQNVTDLAIGVDGAGASGMLLIDDIRLYAKPGELITPADPGSANLVAHYALDGDTQDNSGRGNHGTIVGGAPFIQDPHRGTVLDLGAADAIVEIPHSADIGFGISTDLSLAVWVKPAQTPIQDWTGLVTKNRAVTGDDGYGIWISASSQWHFRVGTAAGDANLSGASGPTEEWHCVVMTHDAATTTLRGYVDGQMIHENTNSDPTPFTVQDALWIGGADGVIEYYTGLIDEVSIYNRALSDAEVLWLTGWTEPIHKPF